MNVDRTVPLRRLFDRRKVLGFVDEPLLSVYRDHGVIYKDERTNLNKTAEDRGIYQLVGPGWLVVNRMKAWQGSLGVSSLRGIVSGHYICFQPNHGENHRYLHYLLRSPRTTAHFRSISRGVRPGQIEIDNEALENTRITLPDVDQQQRIADFLDDRVSRIDRIIAARREQVELSAASHRAQLSRIMDNQARLGLAPMRRFCAGIEQGSSPIAEDRPAGSGEAGVLKTSSVFRGAFFPERHKAIDPGKADAQHVVHTGDVIVIRGSGSPNLVGDAATARTAPGGPALYLSDLTYRLRGLELIPDYAVLALISSRGRSELGSLVRQGSGPAKARGDDIMSISVPNATFDEQRQCVAAEATIRKQLRSSTIDLSRSVALLNEYKSSLITAAVTGELDVTTAGSNIPG